MAITRHIIGSMLRISLNCASVSTRQVKVTRNDLAEAAGRPALRVDNYSAAAATGCGLL